MAANKRLNNNNNKGGLSVLLFVDDCRRLRWQIPCECKTKGGGGNILSHNRRPTTSKASTSWQVEQSRLAYKLIPTVIGASYSSGQRTNERTKRRINWPAAGEGGANQLANWLARKQLCELCLLASQLVDAESFKKTTKRREKDCKDLRQEESLSHNKKGEFAASELARTRLTRAQVVTQCCARAQI